MRVSPALSLGVILLGLAPVAASAQHWIDPHLSHQLGVLEAEQRMARDRAVALDNTLNAWAAQAQADRAIDDLRQRSAPVWLPSIRPHAPAADGPAAQEGAPSFPQIPPERLARSNARVMAITGERR